MDDDDAFLYGDSAPPIPTSVPRPISLEYTKTTAANGIVANLEAQVEEEGEAPPSREVSAPAEVSTPAEEVEEGEEDMDEGEGDESEDDIEIITERPSHSLDFRQRQGAQHAQTAPRAPAPSLTTEYTPRERGTPVTKPDAPRPNQEDLYPPPQIEATPSASSVQGGATVTTRSEDDGVDPSTLPPAQAPLSHPTIDTSQPGVYDGRSILEVDLSALADKGWRRPGADISDWFNYGFDEISWEAYCYRRRELGETAALLKAGVMNFAGMPEEQLTALPTEVRQMVMASANTVMSNGGAIPNANMIQGPNPGMMQQGMMHDMSVMGMGGPMGMGGAPIGPGMGPGMMHPGMGPMGGAMGPGMGGPMGGMNGAAEMGGGVQGMQENQGGSGTPTGPAEMGLDGAAFPGQGPQAQGMIGMGGEFGMQDQGGMVQGMYPGMEQQPAGGTPVPTGPGRGSATPAPGGATAPGFRGRGQVRGPAPGFGRGRGRYGGANAPGRVPSPLPPNVPTGPRSQNKYKDRDTNASGASDNLDYGGGGRDSSHEEDRPRKRRGSPSYGPDARDPKRR